MIPMTKVETAESRGRRIARWLKAEALPLLLMGDHRGASFDGRYFGLVPESEFYGRAVAVYWRGGEGPTWLAL